MSSDAGGVSGRTAQSYYPALSDQATVGGPTSGANASYATGGGISLTGDAAHPGVLFVHTDTLRVMTSATTTRDFAHATGQAQVVRSGHWKFEGLGASAGLNGQQGTAVFTLHTSGSLTASNSGTAIFSARVSLGTNSASSDGGLLTGPPGRGASAAPDAVEALAPIPFVFGRVLGADFMVSGGSNANAGADGGRTVSADVRGDIVGLRVFDAAGRELSRWDEYQWWESFPAPEVRPPEPPPDGFASSAAATPSADDAETFIPVGLNPVPEPGAAGALAVVVRLAFGRGCRRRRRPARP